MPAQPQSEAPAINDVSRDTRFWSKELPDLGLQDDLELPYRLYALGCEPRFPGGPKTVYVGIMEAPHINRRMRTQESQGPEAAHFCKTYKPTHVLGVWPAANRALEACLSYGIAANRSAAALACGALGGPPPNFIRLCHAAAAFCPKEVSKGGS